MKTIAVITGWAEGPWQIRNFRKQLIKNGMKPIDNAKLADIIIAHSEGCYWLPTQHQAELVVLIGLPWWPGRKLISSIVKKSKNEQNYHRKDRSFKWWLNKIAHNGWYILSKPSKSWRGLRYHGPRYLPFMKQGKILLIRPSDDTFCSPEIMKLLGYPPNYKFIEVPGAHDDCWLKPSTYIDLIKKEL
jgi:hypothetical protein